MSRSLDVNDLIHESRRPALRLRIFGVGLCKIVQYMRGERRDTRFVQRTEAIGISQDQRYEEYIRAWC